MARVEALFLFFIATLTSLAARKYRAIFIVDDSGAVRAFSPTVYLAILKEFAARCSPTVHGGKLETLSFELPLKLCNMIPMALIYTSSTICHPGTESR